MIEHEWATSQDPKAMLNHLLYKLVVHDSVVVRNVPLASDRKLRLWVEACREAVHPDSDTWIDLDGPGQPMNSAKTWATHTGEHVGLPFSVRAHLLREIIGNPYQPLPSVRAFGGLMRIGWLTPTVVEMARYAYENRDFTGLPVVADALEEAGCTEEVLLEHLRGSPCPHCKDAPQLYDGSLWPGFSKKCKCKGTRVLHPPHVRGCFVLDLLLGLE